MPSSTKTAGAARVPRQGSKAVLKKQHSNFLEDAPSEKTRTKHYKSNNHVNKLSKNKAIRKTSNTKFEERKRRGNVAEKNNSKRKTISFGCGSPRQKEALLRSMSSSRVKGKEIRKVAVSQKQVRPRKEDKSPGEDNSESTECSSIETRLLTVVMGKPCPRNRMPCDRRKMRRIRLFDPSSRKSKALAGNEAMLQRAKIKVLNELKRQLAMGLYSASPLEQAFLDATNETYLAFDYGRMMTLVRNAQFRCSQPVLP